MRGNAHPPLPARPALAVLAVALLCALPGVAVASLPAHPAPTHDCCTAPEAMPAGACETAPCCITKPSPRNPSLLTGDPAAPVLPAVEAVLLVAPDAPRTASAAAAVVPRARSAPLFLLFVAFLN